MIKRPDIPLKIGAFFFFLFLATSGYCQDKDSIFFAGMHSTPIHLPVDMVTVKGSLPFSGIKVIDARFDTAIAGYSQKNTSGSIYKLVFGANCANEIEHYITDNYTMTGKTGENPLLVILLEKLWLSSSFETGKKEKGEMPVIVQDVLGGQMKVTGPDVVSTNNVVMVRARLLAYNDSNYYSIYQVDTAYLTKKPLIRRNEGAIIEFGIDSMLTRLINKQLAQIRISKRAIPAAAIKDYLTARLNIPAISAQGYLKGVYKTFDEFKNNQPSILHFDVTRAEKTDALYVTEAGGASYLLRDFWGYSDGNNIYVNKGDNFFRLFKQNGAFVFYGFNTLSKIYYTRIGDFLLGTALFGAPAGPENIKFKGNKVPLEIDMETGDCY